MINEPLFLIGFMASGKTKTGKRLAKQLNLPFLDLDEIIESDTNQKITDYFQKYGEKAFRQLESKCLHSLPIQASIVSLGGGTPCFEANLAFIKSKGTSIYLKKSPELLIGRLREKRAKRPLVANLSDKDLQQYVRKTLKEREQYYQQADFTIDLQNESFDKLVKLASQ